MFAKDSCIAVKSMPRAKKEEKAEPSLSKARKRRRGSGGCFKVGAFTGMETVKDGEVERTEE